MLSIRRGLGRMLSLAIPAVLALSLAGCGVNTIPSKEEIAKAKWADVQSAYQRRSDLVPNLVATVQAYAKQERGVLVDVTNARASASRIQVNADATTDPAVFEQYQRAQDQLSGALNRMRVVAENYPDLRSNQNFLSLQSSLEGTENRINVARNDYNEAARDYNTALRTFPTAIWAKTMYASSKPMQYFNASTQAQTAPTVSFDIAPPANPNGAPAASGAAMAPGGGNVSTPGAAPAR